MFADFKTASNADRLKQLSIPHNSDLTLIPCIAIAGFEGRYAVSADGRVWSFAKKKWISIHLRGEYPAVCLSLASLKRGQTTISLHGLVARAWVPRIEGKTYVNHIDGNKQNAAASNLEWVTMAENHQHAFRIGLRNNRSPRQILSSTKNAIIARAARNPLSKDVIEAVKSKVASGQTQRLVAAQYGLHQTTVSRICSGKIYIGT